MTKADIINLIKNDDWMMKTLTTVNELNLPDWYIGAGFVRSKVWDILHNYNNRTPLPDIDVIYFNKNNLNLNKLTLSKTKEEFYYEHILKDKIPNVKISVKNQARMHVFNKDLPYKNSKDALSKWVETATCIGIKLNKNNKLILTTPYGIHDLVNLILKPTLNMNKEIFYKRIEKKGWLKKWPKLHVYI